MKAFAPGHITGFFSAVYHNDPLETGSRGAGVVIEDGVTVEVTSAESTVVTVDGKRTEFETVERVLDALSVTAKVDIETEVPVGCGFGASGAAALATALAADGEFGLDKERDELVATAHVAEVESGTGLGDVVPQSLGGVVIRIEEGAPGEGVFRGIECDETVEYTSFGGLDTADVLGDDGTMESVNAAGERALDRLLDDPDFERFVDLSWEFALETGLVTQRVEDEVERVRSANGRASMAMLGETVFGTRHLERCTGVAEEGARLL